MFSIELLGDPERIEGSTLVFRVTLDEPAPFGGAMVSIVLSPSDVGSAPATIFSAVEGDRIVIAGADYGFSAGALDPSAFSLAGQPNTNLPRFLFNDATNVLAWDADGRAGAGNVVIARFLTDVTLSAADFIMV